MNPLHCPYHDADHLTNGTWECPEPPDGLPAYVGWSDAGKSRATARMIASGRTVHGLPDPLAHGLILADVPGDDDGGQS